MGRRTWSEADVQYLRERVRNEVATGTSKQDAYVKLAVDYKLSPATLENIFNGSGSYRRFGKATNEREETITVQIDLPRKHLQSFFNTVHVKWPDIRVS